MSLSWNTRRNTTTGLFSYSRRLGIEELGFYWNSVFYGTATTVQSFEVKVTDQALLDEQNVVRTWLRLKNMFPLIACKVVEGAGADEVRFHLDDERLGKIQCSEVEVHDIESDEDVNYFTDRLISGPPLDCSKMVSRVVALRRRDRPGVCQILLVIAHLAIDGVGNATTVRSFCNELCRPSIAPKEGLKLVEERLASLRSIEELYPTLQISPARIKWRWAIAKVIAQLRQQKLTGGHTLPCRLTPKSMYTPAHSKEIFFTFPEDTTSSILATCRALKITFGSALNVISQLAHARVIHRLRLQHSQNPSLEFGITQEEWDARIREPMHYTGPINLRPFLSTSWYKNGGSDDVCLAISFWSISLPSMPFCKRPVETWGDQFPAFEELMSRTRFKRRVDFVKRKMDQIFKNPLFLEILSLMPRRVETTKKVALAWRERLENPGVEIPSEPLPPVVFANGGASLGNRDLLVPDEYPLKAQQNSNTRTSQLSAPMLRIGRHNNLLRCSPAEIYLGGLTRHKELEYVACYDGNVYDEKIVQLWMDEAKAATLHYLTPAVESTIGPKKSKL